MYTNLKSRIMENFKITKVLKVPKTSVDITNRGQEGCCYNVDTNDCIQIRGCVDCLFYGANEEYFNKYVADKIKSQKGK